MNSFVPKDVFDEGDDVEQIGYFFIIRFFILLCRQIDEAMTSASIEEKKEEEEAKEESETEREGARRRCGGEQLN